MREQWEHDCELHAENAKAFVYVFAFAKKKKQVTRESASKNYFEIVQTFFYCVFSDRMIFYRANK